MKTVSAALLGFAFAAATLGSAHAAPDVLRVGGGSLSDTIAKEEGFYAKYDLDVRSGSLNGSDAVRAGIADGSLDIADYGVDNAVALQEVSGKKIVVVTTAANTPSELVAQPGIKSLEDLRGKNILVDAPDTQNALKMKKMLMDKGMKPGVDYKMVPMGGTPKRVAAMRENKDYAATMAGPETWMKKDEGWVNLGSSADLIGPMMSYGAWARADWIKAHEDVLVRYIAANIEGQRWIMAPKNKDAVVAMIAADTKLPTADAEKLYQRNLTRHGWSKDMAVDVEGLAAVLKLRAEVEGTWGGKPPSVGPYYDASYQAKALKLVDARKN